MTFKEFGLLPELIKAVEAKGYTAPTAIQSQAIPIILKGEDLLAGSQTGTGKTAGFTIPLLQNLMNKRKAGPATAVRALILTPTRELAMQVEESVRELGKNLPLKSTVIFGGVNIKTQIHNLRRGIDIIVATPGRLLDLVQQRIVSLAHIEIVVLDEADRMLDMGFIHDIRRILKLLPTPRQSLLFSATFSNDIRNFANSLLNSPQVIEATKLHSAVDAISQLIYPVDSARKRELLSHLIKSNNWQQVLVFMRTKHGANRLVTQLQSDGITTTAIHGSKSQNARMKALKDFKKGIFRVLVATDIAARGLDIDQLPHVVNYDLPNVPEDYIHRIGRTGRAGKTGEAVSLVCVDENKLLHDIERLLKQKIPQAIFPNFKPDPSIAAKPIPNGSSSSRGHFPQRNKKPGFSHRNPKEGSSSHGFRGRSSKQYGDRNKGYGFHKGPSRPFHASKSRTTPK